jgi:hypothetical protein
VLASGLAMTAGAAAEMLSSEDGGEATTVTVSDDDGGAALFDATGMAPGHPVSACIEVAYNADGSTAFRLHGTGGGGLAAHLGLVVEAGAGSRFGDCSTFRGEAVYRGTLADFVSHHDDFADGIDLAVPADGSPRSFRFTAEVLDDDTAQGADTTATFTWESRPAPTVPAEPPMTSEAAAAAVVAAAAPVAPDGPAALQEPPVTVSPPAPSVATADKPAAEAAREPGRQERLAPARLTPVRDNPESWAEAVGGAVQYVARQAGFPVLLLAMAALFVLAQDRIDRGDPKLALAPVHPDPDLPFGSGPRS